MTSAVICNSSTYCGGLRRQAKALKKSQFINKASTVRPNHAYTFRSSPFSRFACRAKSNDDLEDEFKRVSEANFRASMSKMWKKEQDAGLDDKYSEALEDATSTCEEVGPTPECAAAWETVDELGYAKDKRDGYTGDSPDNAIKDTSEVEDEESLPRPKAPPADSPARKVMEAEKPCKSEDDCELPSGSFLTAGKMEKMFGGSTKEDFEALFKKYGKDAGEEKFKDIDEGKA